MDEKKAIDFIQKAIEKTKSGTLIWVRLKDFEPDSDQWLKDSVISFAAKISNDASIYLLVDPKEEDNIDFAIYPGNGLSTQYFEGSEEIQSAIIRLYNIVYSKFPNIDSIIDSFINSD